MGSMSDCIAFSWREGEFKHRAEFAVRQRMHQYMTSRLHLKDDWKKEPEPALFKQLVQAIAFLGSIYQMGLPAHKQEWAHVMNDLTAEEREASFDKLGFNPGRHRQLLVFVPSQTDVPRVMSYLAASFFFTTTAMPVIADMQELAQVMFSATLEDSPEFDEVKHAGLLAVKYPLGTYAGIEKASGALFNVLCYRADYNLPTLFVDVLPVELSMRMAEGYRPNSQDIMGFVTRTSASLNRLGDLMLGMTSKIRVVSMNAGRSRT